MPMMNMDAFYDRFVKNQLEKGFVPHCFEKICKEFLIRKNRQGKMNPCFYNIGSYTYNDSKRKIHGRFDLMTEDDNGYTFYECKYTKDTIGPEIVEEEMRQLKECNIHYYRLGFFSKSGYRLEKKDGFLYYTLEDLFRLE